MLVIDSQLKPLDDSYPADEVVLLATRGAKVDRNFRRNYAWAKHAADAGKLKKITVLVAVDGTNWVHAVGAVTSALTGARLHDAAVFSVEPDRSDYAALAAQIGEALQGLAAPTKPKALPAIPALPVIPAPPVEVEVVVADKDKAVVKLGNDARAKQSPVEKKEGDS